MPSDIVDRLENCSYENAPSRCFEAADEIRRLRGLISSPITAEEYFRGTLKVIAHWAEVDLSNEWETGLRGVIRSITDAAKEVLSAYPENPGAAMAEPATVAADLDSDDARPNSGLDSRDRGHTDHSEDVRHG